MVSGRRAKVGTELLFIQLTHGCYTYVLLCASDRAKCSRTVSDLLLLCIKIAQGRTGSAVLEGNTFLAPEVHNFLLEATIAFVAFKIALKRLKCTKYNLSEV